MIVLNEIILRISDFNIKNKAICFGYFTENIVDMAKVS